MLALIKCIKCVNNDTTTNYCNGSNVLFYRYECTLSQTLELVKMEYILFFMYSQEKKIKANPIGNVYLRIS